MIRWDPWREMRDAQRQLSEMSRRVLGGEQEMAGTMVPAVDVLIRGEDLVVRAELPGVDPEKDVTVEVEDRVLRIHGERRQERRQEEDEYVRVESSYGAFERQIPLPHGVSEDDIKASYENGILEVVVPKAVELTRGRRIPVQSSEGRTEITS